MTQTPDASPVWPLAVGFIALAAASFGVTRLVVADDNTAAPAATVVATDAPGSTSTTAVTTTTTVTDTTPVEPTTTAPPVPLNPLAQLETLRALDLEQVESLVGFWVPQVSAKRPGIEADGIVYQLPDIVALHAQLQEQFGAVLLFSADFNYNSTDLWVSIVPIANFSPDGALQFCFDNAIDRDNCFAKFITHDLSITNTVELQP